MEASIILACVAWVIECGYILFKDMVFSMVIEALTVAYFEDLHYLGTLIPRVSQKRLDHFR